MKDPTDDDLAVTAEDVDSDTVPPPLQSEDENWDVPLDEKHIYGESDSDVDQFSQDIQERYNDDEDS